MASHDWSFLYTGTSVYVAVLKPNAALSLATDIFAPYWYTKKEYIACLVRVKLELCTERKPKFYGRSRRKSLFNFTANFPFTVSQLKATRSLTELIGLSVLRIPTLFVSSTFEIMLTKC